MIDSINHEDRRNTPACLMLTKEEVLAYGGTAFGNYISELKILGYEKLATELMEEKLKNAPWTFIRDFLKASSLAPEDMGLSKHLIRQMRAHLICGEDITKTQAQESEARTMQLGEDEWARPHDLAPEVARATFRIVGGDKAI